MRALEKGVEAGADLEQQKFKVREVSQGDKTEAPFAEWLAAELAVKYPNLTQAKSARHLHRIAPQRGKSKRDDQSGDRARAILGQLRKLKPRRRRSDEELTPEDAQNLLKAVEGSGRAGDPTAVATDVRFLYQGEAGLWHARSLPIRFATMC